MAVLQKFTFSTLLLFLDSIILIQLMRYITYHIEETKNVIFPHKKFLLMNVLNRRSQILFVAENENLVGQLCSVTICVALTFRYLMILKSDATLKMTKKTS